MDQKLTQDELMAKLKKALEDESFVADIETRDVAKVKEALKGKGIDFSDEEVQQFINGADGDGELSLDSLDGVSGGGLFTAAVCVGIAGAFCYGFVKQMRKC